MVLEIFAEWGIRGSTSAFEAMTMFAEAPMRVPFRV
jgi:hypothetical protein